ncbi:molybdate ABC transporter substrate-binding protein [Flexibacterium corallicola]|uniref:molybdate ABC transporter substrate-binding protein n=1 Tax=Flexibacterium corallicola TaxID=3037259 RepID=UPI00286F3DCB|nr:molybdate ABC transporter substrate-binding protein [Pseudovibrio sp. M1P-2-3]
MGFAPKRFHLDWPVHLLGVVGLCCAALFSSPVLTGAQASQADATMVFAASSMKDALERTGEAFALKGNEPPRFVFAGSPLIARQVMQGAPADVVVLADREWMQFLKEKGSVQASSIHVIATNELVLVAPKGQEPKLPFPLNNIAAVLGDGRLAVGETQTVPAGRYAKQALQSLGEWDGLKNRLAPMDNVRIALAAVARGEVPLGIVYRTDALIEKGVSVVGTFPNSSHDPIEIYAALTLDAKPQGHTFLTFMESKEGQAIFFKLGFGAGQP